MKWSNRVDRSRMLKVIVIITFFATLFIMRVFEPHFQALSNQTKTLDMRFNYNSIEAYNLLDTLGTQGRHTYINILLIDFIFIASFALLQNFILKYIMGEKLLGTKLRRLLLISYLRGASDIIEDIFILIIIKRYPLRISSLVTYSGFFTKLKFIFLGLWIISIPIILIIKIKTEGSKNHE